MYVRAIRCCKRTGMSQDPACSVGSAISWLASSDDNRKHYAKGAGAELGQAVCCISVQHWATSRPHRCPSTQASKHSKQRTQLSCVQLCKSSAAIPPREPEQTACCETRTSHRQRRCLPVAVTATATYCVRHICCLLWLLLLRLAHKPSRAAAAPATQGQSLPLHWPATNSTARKQCCWPRSPGATR